MAKPSQNQSKPKQHLIDELRSRGLAIGFVALGIASAIAVPLQPFKSATTEKAAVTTKAKEVPVNKARKKSRD